MTEKPKKSEWENDEVGYPGDEWMRQNAEWDELSDKEVEKRVEEDYERAERGAAEEEGVDIDRGG